jgi:hypothetical protein
MRLPKHPNYVQQIIKQVKKMKEEAGNRDVQLHIIQSFT